MERDIKKLISQLTLEEKAGLCSGADHWHTKAVERLGIPSTMFSDGPHGVHMADPNAEHGHRALPTVCFPAACAVAASFDEDLAGKMGVALGRESAAVGLDTLLGPAVNIKRSPLCGRNFEYFSEDPYLAGKLAASYIRGVQSQGVGTSLKHFAANNQEFRRMGCSSDLSDRTLREIYLPSFEEAVKTAQPKTVMCSYNKINGVFAAEHKYLLTDILRNEWGFNGIVVTDWGAVADRVKGIQAGLDLEMPGTGGIFDRHIIAAVKDGSLDEADLDKAVENMLNYIFSCVDDKQEITVDLDEDHELAVRIAEECAVLLENNGILPLSSDKKVAYIGGFAETPRFQGGGSSHVNPHKTESALEAAQKKGRAVTYARGFAADNDVYDPEEATAVVKAASEADIAVVFAGLPELYESEGYDRSHMRLPTCQNKLIAEILSVQPNTVVVLHNGSPVECPWADDVAAVLEMYLAGQGCGEACDRLLWGETNPSGKLPETFPLKLEHNPSYLNFQGNGINVHYAEDSFVGYRYYDTKKMPVQWAFGHGLSYTSFAYSNLRFSAEAYTDNETITVWADITNTGNRPGKEIVQLYVSDKNGTVGRPNKELKGFAKVELVPGETKTVSFVLDQRSLAYYEESIRDWFAPTGRYEIIVASASDCCELCGEIRFTAQRLLPLHVDDCTLITTLIADPRTHDAVEDLAKMIYKRMPHLEYADPEVGSVMEIPLKCFVIFEGYPKDQMEELIKKLNELAK